MEGVASDLLPPLTPGAPIENLGLPAFTIVGLTDRAIQEARERVARRLPQRRLRIPAAAVDGQPRSATSWRTIGADVAYVWPAAFAEDALLSDPVPGTRRLY